MNPIVSIIVPVYNTQKYVGNCIQSILNQTYNDFEIIIVDDGSNDTIAKLCDGIQAKDCRIKTYHTKNHGISCARNYGISKAQGDYICFIDSDDLLDKQMIEILFNDIIKNNADITMCGYNYIELDGKVYSRYGTKKIIRYTKEEALISFFDDYSFGVAVWNKMFKKDLVSKIKFNNDIRINEDRLFLYEYLCLCNKIIYHDLCLYNYIKRENSATTSLFSDKRLDVLRVNDIIENRIINDFNNNELINSFNKNKCLYLIRLHRDLVLSMNRKKYKDDKKKIEKEIKKIYKFVKKELSMFDRVEGFIITKFTFLSVPIIHLLTKLVFLKKIKNIMH